MVMSPILGTRLVSIVLAAVLCLTGCTDDGSSGHQQTVEPDPTVQSSDRPSAEDAEPQAIAMLIWSGKIA